MLDRLVARIPALLLLAPLALVAWVGLVQLGDASLLLAGLPAALLLAAYLRAGADVRRQGKG